MCEPRPESIHPPGRNRPRFDRPPPSCTLRPSPESITYLPRCWWRPRPRHARFGGVGAFALSSVLSRACDSGGARRRCGITRRRRGKSDLNSGKHTQRILLESSAALQTPKEVVSGCSFRFKLWYDVGVLLTPKEVSQAVSRTYPGCCCFEGERRIELFRRWERCWYISRGSWRESKEHRSQGVRSCRRRACTHRCQDGNLETPDVRKGSISRCPQCHVLASRV